MDMLHVVAEIEKADTLETDMLLEAVIKKEKGIVSAVGYFLSGTSQNRLGQERTDFGSSYPPGEENEGGLRRSPLISKTICSKMVTKHRWRILP